MEEDKNNSKKEKMGTWFGVGIVGVVILITNDILQVGRNNSLI